MDLNLSQCKQVRVESTWRKVLARSKKTQTNNKSPTTNRQNNILSVLLTKPGSSFQIWHKLWKEACNETWDSEIPLHQLFFCYSENLSLLKTQSECVHERHKGRDYPGSYDMWLFVDLVWHICISEPHSFSKYFHSFLSIFKNVN